MSDPVRLEAGELAPDFTLPDQNGRRVTLSALRGRKVILYFYGEAGTPRARRRPATSKRVWPLSRPPATR